jgi:hypothetical protein
MKMKLRAAKWLLASCCVIAFSPVCAAKGCLTKTESAPLNAAVGALQGCAQVVTVKLCAPQGKKVGSSAIRDLKSSSNIEFENQVKTIGGGCVEASVTVRSRDVMGPPFLQYCGEGSYSGLAELVYCQ